jgi:hypothetical protein
MNINTNPRQCNLQNVEVTLYLYSLSKYQEASFREKMDSILHCPVAAADIPANSIL